jgi:hypothetical protein
MTHGGTRLMGPAQFAYTASHREPRVRIPYTLHLLAPLPALLHSALNITDRHWVNEEGASQQVCSQWISPNYDRRRSGLRDTSYTALKLMSGKYELCSPAALISETVSLAAVATEIQYLQQMGSQDIWHPG